LKLTKIKEGTTDLLVPMLSVSHKKGPGTLKTTVFFNPVMEFSRDISVLVLREFVRKRKLKILDGLAATGARGVRIANEVDGNFQVILNDHNPKAVEVIEKNIVQNALENCLAENRKMNTLISEEDFDYVDIDPFGSPVQFIDASLQALRKNGMLAVTATDTAPLCGSSPKACLRRYDARSIKTSYCKEAGARVLAGYCVRLAAKYEIALTPLLSFFADHYIRIHFTLDKGARRTDNILKDIGYLIYDPKTKDRCKVIGFPRELGKAQIAGPLWIGDLHDRSFVERMKLDGGLGTLNRLAKYRELWIEEASMPPFFYDQNEIASLTKTQPFPLTDIIQRLEEQGFLASRTHFSPTGFKTDADINEISDLVTKRS
jgi:tRNA (guanine26-N2/guanine27-N2)-dimethyltransferase